MWCKHGESSGKGTKLCPVSFGLAVGIVTFFAVLLWSLWIVLYGMPPEMAAMHIPVPTVGMAFLHALYGLIKGFIFGFFVALLYDLISGCCCKCKCCRRCEKCEKDSESSLPPK